MTSVVSRQQHKRSIKAHRHEKDITNTNGHTGTLLQCAHLNDQMVQLHKEICQSSVFKAVPIHASIRSDLSSRVTNSVTSSPPRLNHTPVIVPTAAQVKESPDVVYPGTLVTTSSSKPCDIALMKKIASKAQFNKRLMSSTPDPEKAIGLSKKPSDKIKKYSVEKSKPKDVTKIKSNVVSHKTIHHDRLKKCTNSTKSKVKPNPGFKLSVKKYTKPTKCLINSAAGKTEKKSNKNTSIGVKQPSHYLKQALMKLTSGDYKQSGFLPQCIEDVIEDVNKSSSPVVKRETINSDIENDNMPKEISNLSSRSKSSEKSSNSFVCVEKVKGDSSENCDLLNHVESDVSLIQQTIDELSDLRKQSTLHTDRLNKSSFSENDRVSEIEHVIESENVELVGEKKNDLTETQKYSGDLRGEDRSAGMSDICATRGYSSADENSATLRNCRSDIVSKDSLQDVKQLGRILAEEHIESYKNEFCQRDSPSVLENENLSANTINKFTESTKASSIVNNTDMDTFKQGYYSDYPLSYNQQHSMKVACDNQYNKMTLHQRKLKRVMSQVTFALGNGNNAGLHSDGAAKSNYKRDYTANHNRMLYNLDEPLNLPTNATNYHRNLSNIVNRLQLIAHTSNNEELKNVLQELSLLAAPVSYDKSNYQSNLDAFDKKLLLEQLKEERLSTTHLKSTLRDLQTQLDVIKTDRHQLLLTITEKDSELAQCKQEQLQLSMRLNSNIDSLQHEIMGIRDHNEALERENHILCISIMERDKEICQMHDYIQQVKLTISDIIDSEAAKDLSADALPFLPKLKSLLKHDNLFDKTASVISGHNHSNKDILSVSKQQPNAHSVLSLDNVAIHNLTPPTPLKSDTNLQNHVQTLLKQYSGNERLQKQYNNIKDTNSHGKFLDSNSANGNIPENIVRLTPLKEVCDHLEKSMNNRRKVYDSHSVTSEEVDQLCQEISPYFSTNIFEPDKQMENSMNFQKELTNTSLAGILNVETQISLNQNPTSSYSNCISTSSLSRYSVTDYFNNYKNSIHVPHNNDNFIKLKDGTIIDRVEPTRNYQRDKSQNSIEIACMENSTSNMENSTLLKKGVIFPLMNSDANIDDDDTVSTKTGLTISTVSTLKTVDDYQFRQNLATLDKNILRIQQSIEKSKNSLKL